MTAPAYLDYFYGDEVKIDSFYRLPRVFLTNEFYSDISTEVTVLYDLMLDRVALSMRNGWREPDGRVFSYFTLNDVKQMLHVGKNKAVSLFRQREEAPETVRNGLTGLLNECAVGVRRLGDILARRLTNGGGVPMNADSSVTAAPDVRKESTGKPIIQSYVRDLTYEGDR